MAFYSPFWFEINTPFATLFTLFNGYFVLWYLSGALISGIIVYSLRRLKVSYALTTIILLYLIGCSIQTLGNLHVLPDHLNNIFNLNYTHRNALLLCMPFFYIGYLINKYSVDKKVNINASTVFLMILIVAFEAILQSRLISSKEGIDQLISLIFAAPIIFIFFKNKTINGKSKELANISTAIYLIHPIFILLFKYLDLQVNTILLTLCVLVLSLISSVFLVTLNRKFKYIL